ncbi:hypothetical protein [Nocardioides lijunqiniae]|uniref:hypothetical protein n=1 Tax=Nocardioides lijunqiniae TaxID=2760832 RepID=UPI0018776241|nr:hypothetical protein [Nocardioides lijunqiniae]
MRGTDRAVVVVIALALSGLTALLIAGHGPWAGRTLIAFSPRHGLNSGDVPILLTWAVGMAGCSYLLLRRD